MLLFLFYIPFIDHPSIRPSVYLSIHRPYNRLLISEAAAISSDGKQIFSVVILAVCVLGRPRLCVCLLQHSPQGIRRERASKRTGTLINFNYRCCCFFLRWWHTDGWGSLPAIIALLQHTQAGQLSGKAVPFTTTLRPRRAMHIELPPALFIWRQGCCCCCCCSTMHRLIEL